MTGFCVVVKFWDPQNNETDVFKYKKTMGGDCPSFSQ